MAAKTLQRFYKHATTEPAEDGLAVLLDGRPVRTPAQRVPLVVPTAPLARAIAAEWDSQGEEVRPAEMPLTALACTGHDVARPRRDELVDSLARYAETDLVCYRVDSPQSLARRQQATWQPLLDWAALAYDARLNVTTGILPAKQPAQALQALRRAVESLDDMHLAALSASVQAAGSLVIGLALVNRQVDAAQAFHAAELESTYQIEAWGEDAEAMQRREALRAELEAARTFVDLLSCDDGSRL